MAVTKRKTKKTKTAAKKTARKTAKKTVQRARKTVRIKYSCGPFCKATPKFAHMRFGDTVVMQAIGTDVSIRFIGGSPLTGSANFSIPEGTQRTATVTATGGSFKYRLGCSECPSRNSPPEMIVP